MTDAVEPYPDGRWSLADHPPEQQRTDVWCRGNVGEVFPNVVTPLASSLFMGAVASGQAKAVFERGLVTKKQHAQFLPTEAWFTGVFAGYLYANVSLARTAAARTPGLSTQDVDEQMFGLHGAPPHVRGKGERDLPTTLRAAVSMAWVLRRPDDAQLRADQDDIARYVAALPAIASATDAQLLAIARSLPNWTDRMMHHLLGTSTSAGLSRAILERLVAKIGEPGLENRLTAGLGTVESAEPAQVLWRLGRMVVGDAALTAIFDEGLDGLDTRLRLAPEGARLAGELDAFAERYGSRGPDEWELASPTWGTDPGMALALIDRLRLAPEDRDPQVVGARLAAERATLLLETRGRVPSVLRPLFDRAAHGAAVYAAHREATKAAFMRALYPTRLALAELARRSGLAHDDFFLLTFGEAEASTRGELPTSTELEDRRARRDFLQSRIPPFWFQGPMSSPTTWEQRHANDQRDTTPRTLSGMGVCPGVATGTARVVMRPDAPGDLGPGDILVAPITDPAWTPLFLAAAGVVVDVGAQQSHAAIVSRELGIPAVVSVAGASATIPDGTRVTVDGSTGVVTIHAE